MYHKNELAKVVIVAKNFIVSLVIIGLSITSSFKLGTNKTKQKPMLKSHKIRVLLAKQV